MRARSGKESYEVACGELLGMAVSKSALDEDTWGDLGHRVCCTPEGEDVDTREVERGWLVRIHVSSRAETTRSSGDEAGGVEVLTLGASEAMYVG